MATATIRGAALSNGEARKGALGAAKALTHGWLTSIVTCFPAQLALSKRQIRYVRGKPNEVNQVIPESHPLRDLFVELVGRHYNDELGLRDQEVTGYVANMLAEFCEVDQLFKLLNAAGKPMDDVGEMLLESDPIYGPAPSFDRERQVRKHIGDFTLFFTGMFPESINHLRLRRQRLENFVDFMKAGKESYYIVSKFEFFEYAKVAPMFARLSEHFEQCVYGLNLVKNELAEMQHPITSRAREILM
jgi:hypothetical protein